MSTNDRSVSAPSQPETSYGYGLPGRRFAQVAMTSVFLGIFGVIAVFLPQARLAVVPLCIAFIPLFAVALVAAVPLAMAGRDAAPAVPLVAGWAVILGGAACDIFSTVSHSPDLAREANPVLRGLLDNNVALEQVYLFGGIIQLLFAGLAIVLWHGLLKHRHTLAATMPASGSLLAYFKAGTGGRELSYRQWLCPLVYADLPWAYHLAWSIGVMFVGVSVYRFYVALEWYGVAPVHPLWVRFLVPSVLLLATCWLYAVWLRGARIATRG
jgi:hypothetical protein